MNGSTDPDRTVRDLLDRLADCRVRVVVEGGRPLLRPPASGLTADEQKRLDLLMPAVREHRAAILDHLHPATDPAPEVAGDATPTGPVPWNCSPCRRWFYAPRPEARNLIANSPVWCDQPNCPQRR